MPREGEDGDEDCGIGKDSKRVFHWRLAECLEEYSYEEDIETSNVREHVEKE